MTLAYLILAHKNLNQVALLINLLAPNNAADFCFVHIDAKVDQNSLNIFRKSVENAKCRIVDNAIDISWGSYRMIEATLLLIKEALAYPAIRFDYFSLHSGEDLPLKTNHKLKRYLHKNIGKEFLEYFEITEKSHWKGNGGLDRLEYYWFVDQIGFDESKRLVTSQKQALSKRAIPNGVSKFYGGSQWWTLTRDCVLFVTETLLNDKKKCDYFRFSFIPDETLFQTVVLNSTFASKVVNDNLRLIDWTSGPSYPKIWKFEDRHKLTNSTSFFARKFNYRHDFKIIKEVISHIHPR